MHVRRHAHNETTLTACAEDVTDLLHTVYGDLHTPVEALFSRRSILTPTNSNVDAINDAAAAMLPGKVPCMSQATGASRN